MTENKKEYYCAFLRGVNVRGTAMKMADLKRVFDSLGYKDGRTLLASGNVIFSAKTDDVIGLKAEIETALSNAFSYDAFVFIRNQQQITEILRAAEVIQAADNYHRYLLLIDGSAMSDELEQLFQTLPHGVGERLIVLPQAVFWIVQKGGTLESVFGSKLLSSRYKNHLTSRNINTIEKIFKALQTMTAD